MRANLIYAILCCCFVGSAKSQQLLDGDNNVTVQLLFSNASLEHGTQFNINKTSFKLTITILPNDTFNMRSILPVILTVIVSDEVKEKLNGSQYLNTYYNFYADFGNSLTFEDLFGNRSANASDDFLNYLLAKFEVAAGTSFTGPLANEFLAIRTGVLQITTSDELIGFYNGNYLSSFHENARNVAAKVLAGKSEAELVVAALTGVELAVGTAQLYIVKLLAILREVELF